MDNMSYRNNRPPQRKQPEQELSPQPADSRQSNTAAPQRTVRKPQPYKRKNKLGVIVVAVIVLLLASVAIWFMFGKNAVAGNGIETDKYQAVFFSNDQIYFGKLSELNSENMRLTNVFYLKNKEQADSKNANPQQDASDVELVKLGGEIHGPEDEMIIAKDQILFFENLKSDGTVSKTIQGYQQQNN